MCQQCGSFSDSVATTSKPEKEPAVQDHLFLFFTVPKTTIFLL